MSDLRTTFGACGFDPSYERIAVEALKRGHNGEGSPFEVDVTKRSGEYLGTVALRGDETGVIGDAVDDRRLPYEDSVEVLGQRVADLLVDKIAEQRLRPGGTDHLANARV